MTTTTPRRSPPPPLLLPGLVTARASAYDAAGRDVLATIYSVALPVVTGAALFAVRGRGAVDVALGAATGAALLLVAAAPFAMCGWFFGAAPRGHVVLVVALAATTPLFWPAMLPWGRWAGAESGSLLTLACAGAALAAAGRVVYHAARRGMGLHDSGAAMTTLLPFVTLGMFASLASHQAVAGGGAGGALDAGSRALLAWSWKGTAAIALGTYLWFAALWWFYPGWSFAVGTVGWRRPAIRRGVMAEGRSGGPRGAAGRRGEEHDADDD